MLNMQIMFKNQTLRSHNKVKSKLPEITQPLRSHTKAAPDKHYSRNWSVGHKCGGKICTKAETSQ